MKDKEKTETILKALRAFYEQRPRFVTFPELRLGSGFDNNSQRRVDFFVIDSSKGNTVIGYEIKAGRQDFLKDIKDPLKQRGARQYCNEFYYICLGDLIKPEEVPLWAGLVRLLPVKSNEYGYNGYNGYDFNTIVPAPFREKNVPTWGLICSLIRKFKKQLAEENHILYL